MSAFNTFSTLSVVAACMFATVAHAQSGAPNLARTARVTGSSSRSDYPLSQINDGDMTTSGSTGAGQVKDQWMQLDWDVPQTMSGIVMYSTGPWTQTIEAQVEVAGHWVTVGKSGSATQKAPLVIVFSFTPTTTKSLRFLFDGGAAFYEIEVYDDPAKIEQIVKEHVLPRIVVAGDLRGHLIGTVSEDAGSHGIEGAEVLISGAGRSGEWSSSARTDANGFFRADLPFGATGRIHFEARVRDANDASTSARLGAMRSCAEEAIVSNSTVCIRAPLQGLAPWSPCTQGVALGCCRTRACGAERVVSAGSALGCYEAAPSGLVLGSRLSHPMFPGQSDPEAIHSEARRSPTPREPDGGAKVVAELDADASDVSTVLTPRPLKDRVSLDGVWDWAGIPSAPIPGVFTSGSDHADGDSPALCLTLNSKRHATGPHPLFSFSSQAPLSRGDVTAPLPRRSFVDSACIEAEGVDAGTNHPRLQPPLRVTPLPGEPVLQKSPSSRAKNTSSLSSVASLRTAEASRPAAWPKWSKVKVPAHWEMEGLSAESGKALYRRAFAVPCAWRGKRIKLRADAVYSKCQVWVNGKRVGGHDGGATPFELDVTDAAKVGSSNEILIQVDARSMASDLDNASYFAYYELAGIWQHIELFAVEPVHISHLAVRTTYDKAYRNAELALEVDMVHEGRSGQNKHDLSFRLLDPRGREVAVGGLRQQAELGAWARVGSVLKTTVENPEPWNAEAPRLYTVVGYVDGRRVLQQPVGFRQIEIKDRAVTLNGTPLKIRGISRLDCHPLMGRALTPEIDKHDAEMIKSANFNAVRATIFPPHPVALDEADEKGLYYENEGPTCWGNHASDLRYVPVYAGIMCEYLERDRNHPCVIDWSICNESDYGSVFSITQRAMKAIDPTRLYSATWGDDTLDVDTYHHPVSLSRIQESLNDSKPAFFDECLGLFHGWEDLALWLDLDPGMKDYWVVGIGDILRAVNAGHNQLGTIQFCWCDDTSLVPGKGVDVWRHSQPPIRYSESIYKMPKRGMVGDVVWGTVDGRRRPRPEYWLSKKLYSPVQIEEKPLAIPASGPVVVPVENFNQFIDLNRYVCRWSLGSASGTARAQCKPMSKGVLAVPAAPKQDDVLALEFFDEKGRPVDAYRLAFKQHDIPVLASSGRPARVAGQTAYLDEVAAIRLIGKDCELAYDQTSAALARCLKDGEVVLNAGPSLRLLKATAPTEAYPTGFPLNEGVRGAADPTAWHLSSATTHIDGGQAVLDWKGSYGKDLVGGYQIRMDDAGDIEIRYEFKYNGDPIAVREVALEFALPLSCDRLEWDRRAEYSVYPPDHIGRPHGTAVPHPAVSQTVPPGKRPWALDDHPWGCNDFRSTKRNIYWASLTNASGEGVKVISNGTQHIRATVGVHDILLKVMDWYGGEGSTYAWGFHYGDGKHIAAGDVLKGVVRLQLLGGGRGASGGPESSR